MKKTAFLSLLLGVMFVFTQSTNSPTNPLIVTLYERMILYQNCANLVGTSMPALGIAYKPTFKVDNGSTTTYRETDVIITPKDVGICKLTVSTKDDLSGKSEDFTVLPVPAPIVFLGDNTGTEISTAEPVKKGDYRVFVRPEANFLNTLPKEATYRISGLTINIYRKGQKVATLQIENGALDLKNAQAGDMVQAIITKAERINSNGQLFSAIPSNPIINFMVKD